MKLPELLGDPAWLFDLIVPIRPLLKAPEAPQELKWELDESHDLPLLSTLSEQATIAKVAIAWSEAGLFFHAKFDDSVTEKKRTGAGSVYTTLFVDTRWSPKVHRATSTCHRFVLILDHPSKAQSLKRGHGELAPIQRARANPAEVHPSQIATGTIATSVGYDLKTFIKSESLTGYQPLDYQDIGLFYVINDSRLGNQCMARSLQCPYFEDPSLWCRGKLIQPS